MSDLSQPRTGWLEANAIDHARYTEVAYLEFESNFKANQSMRHPDHLHSYYRHTAIHQHIALTALSITQHEVGVNSNLDFRRRANVGAYFLDGAALGIQISDYKLGHYFDEELCDMRDRSTLPWIDMSGKRIYNELAADILLKRGITNLENYCGKSMSKFYLSKISKALNVPPHARDYFHAGTGTVLGYLEDAEMSRQDRSIEPIKELDFPLTA